MWLPRDEWSTLRALASEQCDVVSRAQLAGLGISRHDIRNQVRARRWRLIGNTVVLHRGPLSQDQKHWVAVMHAGQGAALASLTAAALHGLEKWPTKQVHVVVSRGTRVRPLPWMKIHISRRFTPEDVHPTRTPAQCRVERAVIDAATWKPHPKLACAVLCSAVQQRIVTVDALREALHAAGAVRHRKHMLAVLTDIEGGSQSMSEIDFVRLCKRAGLPRPEQQSIRHDSAGRKRYLDARFTRPDGRVLLVEVDGGIHLEPLIWWDDQSRSNDVGIADDALVLRFSTVALRTDRERIIRQLRAAYFGPTHSQVVRRSGRISARSA